MCRKTTLAGRAPESISANGPRVETSWLRVTSTVDAHSVRRRTPLSRVSAILRALFAIPCAAAMNAAAPTAPRVIRLLPAQRHRRRGPRARRLPRGDRARVAVHAQQLRAGGAQSHRHLVHRPHLDAGHRRDGRGVLAGARLRAAARRRRHRGADAGRAGVRRASAQRGPRRRSGLRSGARCSRRHCSWRLRSPGRGCCARSRSIPRSSAWRSSSGSRAWPWRPSGVALWALLGFFNGIARPRVTLAITLLVAVLNAASQPALHLRVGHGNRGLGLGHERRAARRWRQSRWPALHRPGLNATLSLAPDVAVAARQAPASSSRSDFRWACCTRRTCSASRSSRS